MQQIPSASPYHALVASPLPRAQSLVKRFARRGSYDARRMVLWFCAILIAVWVMAAYAGLSGGSEDGVVSAIASPLFVLLPLGVVFGGVLLLYGSVSETVMRRALRHGRVFAAREVDRRRVRRRAWTGVRVTLEVQCAGGIRRAQFDVSFSAAPPQGVEFSVLEGKGDEALVVWPPGDAHLARWR